MARTIKTCSVMKLVESRKDIHTECATEVRIKRMAWGEQGVVALREPEKSETEAGVSEILKYVKLPETEKMARAWRGLCPCLPMPVWNHQLSREKQDKLLANSKEYAGKMARAVPMPARFCEKKK